ncbi:MAG: hypothetical protein ACQEVA_08825 [Myxococcota bacterium]
MSIEKFLGYLAGDDENSRVELVQVGQPGQTPTLEMRYQREGGSLGWVTQKRIKLAPGQVADLRSALNLMDRDARDAEISAKRKAKSRSLTLVDIDQEERSSG